MHAINSQQRAKIIAAALLALFLGALDALVIAAAMPTVVAELGGLHLYSWVYSTYFLARALSLPVFGKLADLYKSRNLFVLATVIFLLASAACGGAWSMGTLISARIIQGIGAGGIFALVYIVLAEVSEPARRGRTLSLASAVWGVASVLGPTMGGLIVTWFSWRWIFWVNLPLGVFSIWGIGVFFVETRPKGGRISLDFAGLATLTTAVLALLLAFLLGGREYAWTSPPVLGLLLLSAAGTAAFVAAEKRAADPILSIHFFGNRGFAAGNAAVFLSSVTIFSLFAFAPLFIQAVQGRSPLLVGVAMVSLSMGWSLGSLALGQVVDRMGLRTTAVSGGVCLAAGCALTLTFTAATTVAFSFACFFLVGIGMGFVALSTLLTVQRCLEPRDLGVATASNQFARTLGGTVGVGVGGGLVAMRIDRLTDTLRQSGLMDHLPAGLSESGTGVIEQLLKPEFQARLSESLRTAVQTAVTEAVRNVFWMVLVTALLCMAICFLLPPAAGRQSGSTSPHNGPD